MFRHSLLIAFSVHRAKNSSGVLAQPGHFLKTRDVTALWLSPSNWQCLHKKSPKFRPSSENNVSKQTAEGGEDPFCPNTVTVESTREGRSMGDFSNKPHDIHLKLDLMPG